MTNPRNISKDSISSYLHVTSLFKDFKLKTLRKSILKIDK